MRHNRRQQDDGPGQDSFLDIVANLVGILIILVMVVGARAKDAWIETSPDGEPTEFQQLDDEVATSKKSTESLQRNYNELAAKVRLQKATVAARRAERQQIQLMIKAVEIELEKQRKQLGSADQRALEIRRDLNAAKSQLADLEQQRRVVENSASETIVIEHIPTPMAKTVFGKEVHFRLLSGRLAYVPLEELIEKMKDEIRVKAEKLRSATQTIETVGPVGGFHLRYKLALKSLVEDTQFGPSSRKVPKFVGFYLQPTSDQLGEPFQQAIQPGSQFQRLIAGLDPNTTTITVWVYPDSFNEFLELKRRMFKRGFLTASWPLPEGAPISGGPNGRRSAAQ